MPKPRKYDAIVATLPALGLDPERKVVLEAVKGEILAAPATSGVVGDPKDYVSDAAQDMRMALNLLKRSAAGRPWATEFARAYAEARDLKDIVDGWASDLNLLIEAFQALMVDQMEAEGVEAVTLAGGRRVSTYPEPYSTVVDKEAFRQWCIANGLENKLALPWQATNALVKERLLAGEPEPPGVQAWAKTVVRLAGA